MKSSGDGRARPPSIFSIFPEQVHIGDRFTEADVGDEEREWEVMSRPVTYKQGKEVRARAQRPGEPRTAREQSWPAYSKITIRRNSTTVSGPVTRQATEAGDAGADLDDFHTLHRGHGDLPPTVREETPNGYRLKIACACGATFERWVTTQEAVDLVRARVQAMRNSRR